MNKTTLTLILLISTSAAAHAVPNTGAPHAVTIAEARQGVQAAITKRIAARRQHDAAAYLSTYAPTWTLTDVSGKTRTYAVMSKTVIDRFTHLSDTQMYKMAWKVTQVTVAGAQAHAAIAAHYAHPTRRTPSGLVYVYEDIVSDTVWERTPGGWVERSERLTYHSDAFSTRALTAGDQQTPRF